MLIDDLHSPVHLLNAWNKLNKTNPESFGLSMETISSFRSQIDIKIPIISQEIIKGRYKFSDTRASVIPKDNGKFRPLQIPEVKDRVVLKAIALILEGCLSKILQDGEGVSFAYQKGKGIQDAILKMREYYNAGNTYILEADIVDFFPTVDRNKLLNIIFENLPDDSLNSLIQNGISQKVSGLERIPEAQRILFKNTGTGIPQGNPLSPLFSNVFLRPFDAIMKKEKLSLIRYADDFIVMCKSQKEAEKAYALCKKILENTLGLQLHKLSVDPDSKTKILQPNKTDFSFLSVGFDGMLTYPSQKNVNQFLANIDKLCNATPDAKDVLTVLRRVNNSLDGWVSTFSFTDDLQRYFEAIDTSINKYLLVALKRFGWKLSSKSLSKVKAKYRSTNNKGNLDSGECLSNIQRKSSGIPFSNEILSTRKKSAEKKKEHLNKR